MPDPAVSSASSAMASRNSLVARLSTLIASHATVDVYAAFVPPLIGVLQVRCDMTRQQAAWLLGIGSLTSGFSQPLAAWLADRTDSRLFGALGLAMSAVCLSLIGLPHDFAALAWLYAIGSIGSGIFHPIGAASAGQLSDRLPGERRSLGVSMFYVAGMAGSIVGALIARAVATAGDSGFNALSVAIAPGLLVAVALHIAIRRIPHRHEHHRSIRFDQAEAAARWLTVGLLYCSSALRFIVNMALVYLVVRWAEARAAAADPTLGPAAVAEAGGRVAATLSALMVVGMGVGGLVTGSLIRPGWEKWPLVLAPLVLCPAVALIGPSGFLGAAILLVLAGAGFAATVPTTLSLAQRLLPHRTGLASALMLGGAWALAVLGPRLAEWCLTGLRFSISTTFVLTAVVLACSGLVCLPLRTTLIRQTKKMHVAH